MKLPEAVRNGIDAVTSRVPDLDEAKAMAEKVPGIAINTALRGAEIGVAGAGLLTRTASKAADAARTGVAAGASLLGLSGASEVISVQPLKEDPWAGGPLRPVDDIRDAAALTDEVAAEIEDLPTGETLTHADLPLEDYDHLTLGDLRTRIRKLGVGELVQLREYEHAHANRLPVVKSFDTRLATLAKKSTKA